MEEGYWCHFGWGIGGYWRVLEGIGVHVERGVIKALSKSPRKPKSPEKQASLRGVLERHLCSFYNTKKEKQVRGAPPAPQPARQLLQHCDVHAQNIGFRILTEACVDAITETEFIAFAV